MEGGKSACKQGKKKTTVSTGAFNGGGIGGVVILGGALAAAAVIAFLAKKKNEGRPRKKNQSTDSGSSCKFILKNKSNTDEESEGLQLLVQPSPPSVHFNPCCKSNGTSEMGSPQIGCKEFISTQNSILEKMSLLEINGGKETLQNGDCEYLLYDKTKPKPGNITLCEDYGIDNEEFALPVLEILPVLKEEVNKINDAGEEPPLMEAIEEAKKQEGAFETVIVKHVEEIPPMKSVEEDTWEKEIEEGDEDEEEKSEQGSEETGDSSMESNAEAIWPLESIEKLSMALKEMKFNYQNSGEKIGEEDGTVKNDTCSKDSNFYVYDNKDDDSTRKSMVISANKDTIKLQTVNDQPVRLGMVRMSILGTLLLMLMLVFLTHHQALFSYLVNGDSVL